MLVMLSQSTSKFVHAADIVQDMDVFAFNHSDTICFPHSMCQLQKGVGIYKHLEN